MSEIIKNQQEQQKISPEQQNDPIFQKLFSLKEKTEKNIENTEFDKWSEKFWILCNSMDPKNIDEFFSKIFKIPENKLEKIA